MRRLTVLLILILQLIPATGGAEIYLWIDDQGIQNYTAQLENIPEPYRSTAQPLSLPPAPMAPAEPTPDPTVPDFAKIPFSPGSPVLVKAGINGLGTATLILDTGAERTIISPAVVARLGLSLENEPPVILKGVTGMGTAGRVWVKFIEIEKIKVGPLLIAVYDAELKGAEGLLGRDFLSHLNLTIDSKEKTVTLTSH
jgi:predicted aspartyl protease